MPNRLAGILGLIAFSLCLLVGLIEADNDFGTVVWRAIVAMGGTLLVGYVLGLMAERMIGENVSAIGQAPQKSSEDPSGDGR